MASRSSNRKAVPEAKGALDKFKYEVADELGVPLKEGYNGDLTSKQNGSVGGYMVKKIVPMCHKKFTRYHNHIDSSAYDFYYTYSLAIFCKKQCND